LTRRPLEAINLIWTVCIAFLAQLKVKGDNDPVDVVEIGSAVLKMGSVTPVSGGNRFEAGYV